ncbi:MAG: hypothetical protein SNF69_07490 [Rikenellaceae bacterium]
MKRFATLISLLLLSWSCQESDSSDYSILYASKGTRKVVNTKIESEEWAKVSYTKLRNRIDPYVERHTTDPEWITSRLAMYWKDGERYTQCYLIEQNWDYGEGNAPVPTVRFPGMRTWNRYANVSLEQRTPYNESGDMWGVDRLNPDAEPVLVPYKQSGHMIRYNNGDILDLARDASFVYWLTQDEKYAKFAADIYYQWLIGTYYMNPILDPTGSTGSQGGWEPGGICGYYDYEQIHDDLAERGAAIYGYLRPYLATHPNDHLDSIGKTTKEVNDEVLKRFIDLGLIRGGRQGNWNVNCFARIMAPIVILDSNSKYADGKGREYYIEYFLSKDTDYHESLVGMLKNYDKVTGLWNESPGYAFGTVTSILDFATMLYPLGVDIIADNPILQKAAEAIIPWMDARGNLVVFGDTRGGIADYTIFERLLTYYTNIGDKTSATKMASIITQAINNGTYSRDNSNWVGLITQEPLKSKGERVEQGDISYSELHRFFTLKDFNGSNKLMATIYGGRGSNHLTANGLAITLYGYDYALAPDAAGYESYWSADVRYHQSATGANTIMPGYTEGDITVNHTYPTLASDEYFNSTPHDSFYRMVDISADEKRRILTMVRCGDESGYYLDIFESDQMDNDYIFHNVGSALTLSTNDGQPIELEAANDLGAKYSAAYSYFTSPRKVNHSADFIAHWDVAQGIEVDFRMVGGSSRTLYTVDAPYSTLNGDLTPNGVSSSPQSTPTLIVRQNGVNGKTQPFIGLYEAHKGNPIVKSFEMTNLNDNECEIEVRLNDGSVDIINYNQTTGLVIKRQRNV